MRLYRSETEVSNYVDAFSRLAPQPWTGCDDTPTRRSRQDRTAAAVNTTTNESVKDRV
jgi:hypothetical protein